MARTALTPYGRLKRKITRQLPRKKLIGDIIISDTEYAVLMEHLQNVYRRIRRGESIKEDPMLAVALVQIGIRRYEGGGYWNLVADELGVSRLSAHEQAALGSSFYLTLLRYNMPNAGDGRWVKNILMHGLVSDYYAPRLFDFLFAFYRLDLMRDYSRLDREMMNGLIEVMTRNDNTGRTYWLVQQTADALRLNPRGARPRVRRLIRMMDRAFWDQILPVKTTNRLSRRFLKWQQESPEYSSEYQAYHEGGRARGLRQFSSPYLECDLATTEFSLVLPSQLVRADDPGVASWRITSTLGIRDVPVDISESVVGFRTEEGRLEIPASWLFGWFELELLYAGVRMRRFTIEADCIRFFDSGGNFIRPDALPSGTVYGVTRCDEPPVSAACVVTERRGELALTYLDLEEGDVVRLPDGKPVSVGKQLEEGLLLRGRVAGAHAPDAEQGAKLIYRLPPSVFLKMQPSQVAGTLVVVNGTRYRLSDGDFVEVLVHDRSGASGYIINLAEYGCVADGFYQVWVDVPGDRAQRYFKFALLREFSFLFEDAPYVFAPRGTVRFPEGLSIVAGQGLSKLPEENAFNFEIQPEEDYLEFHLRTASDDIPLLLSVPAFKWKLEQGDWQIEQPDEVWHTDFPHTIVLKHPSDSLTLSMDVDQTVTYYKQHDCGLFVCDLTRFYSWIDRSEPRRTVYLEFAGEKGRREFCDVITRSQARSCLIQGDYLAGRLTCEVDIVGRAAYYADTWYGDELLAEKVPIDGAGRFELHTRLRSGVYRVDLFEVDEDDTGFGSQVYLPLKSFSQELVNPADLRGQPIRIESIRQSGRVQRLPWHVSCEVRHLQPLGAELHTYIGEMTALDRRERTLVRFNVKVHIPNLQRVNQMIITVQDEDDFVELLYDDKRKIIVKDEDRNLPRAERYRRYTPLYPDEYSFGVTFIPTVAQPATLARNVGSSDA
ncbi:MAG: hypothetical protein ACOX18_00500 [Bacillota bacterium]